MAPCHRLPQARSSHPHLKEIESLSGMRKRSLYSPCLSFNLSRQPSKHICEHFTSSHNNYVFRKMYAGQREFPGLTLTEYKGNCSRYHQSQLKRLAPEAYHPLASICLLRVPASTLHNEECFLSSFSKCGSQATSFRT